MHARVAIRVDNVQCEGTNLGSAVQRTGTCVPKYIHQPWHQGLQHQYVSQLDDFSCIVLICSKSNGLLPVLSASVACKVGSDSLTLLHIVINQLLLGINTGELDVLCFFQHSFAPSDLLRLLNEEDTN